MNDNVLETISGNKTLTLKAHGSGVVDVDDTLKLNGLNFDGDSETYTSVDTDLSSVSANHDTLASAKAIEAQIAAIPTVLTITADSGNDQTIDLKTESLDIEGTSGEIETSASTDKITIGLPNNVTIGNNLTVTNNLTVSNNISVAGRLDVDQIRLDGTEIRITSTDEANEDLILKPASQDGEVRVGGIAAENGDTGVNQ